MSIFTPVKVCIISFLTLLTFPLAILAGITTTLAFSVLLFRVSLVYVDFLLSFIPTYLFGRHTYSSRLQSVKPSPITTAASSQPGSTGTGAGTYTRRRRRRPSSVSVISAEALTPVFEKDISLMPSAGMGRDFEGLGGWREGDDELWTTINSRFELSEGTGAIVGQNHHRALSGGRISHASDGGLTTRQGSRSPGAKRTPPVSPNTSKVRTAPPGGFPSAFTAVGGDEVY